GNCIRRASCSPPGRNTEAPTCLNTVDAYVLVGKRGFRLTYLGRARRLQKINRAGADYCAVTLAIKQQGGLLINGDVAWRVRPSIRIDPAHECQVAAHAI